MSAYEWTCKHCRRTFRASGRRGPRKTVCRQCANVKQYLKRRGYYRKWFEGYSRFMRGEIADLSDES